MVPPAAERGLAAAQCGVVLPAWPGQTTEHGGGKWYRQAAENRSDPQNALDLCYQA